MLKPSHVELAILGCCVPYLPNTQRLLLSAALSSSGSAVASRYAELGVCLILGSWPLFRVIVLGAGWRRDYLSPLSTMYSDAIV